MLNLVESPMATVAKIRDSYLPPEPKQRAC